LLFIDKSNKECLRLLISILYICKTLSICLLPVCFTVNLHVGSMKRTIEDFKLGMARISMDRTTYVLKAL